MVWDPCYIAYRYFSSSLFSGKVSFFYILKSIRFLLVQCYLIEFINRRQLEVSNVNVVSWLFFLLEIHLNYWTVLPDSSWSLGNTVLRGTESDFLKGCYDQDLLLSAPGLVFVCVHVLFQLSLPAVCDSLFANSLKNSLISLESSHVCVLPADTFPVGTDFSLAQPRPHCFH